MVPIDTLLSYHMGYTESREISPESSERMKYSCNIILREHIIEQTTLFPDIVFLMEGQFMAISYKKLWKVLIDRDMKKKDLQELSGVSSASITKLGKNENVNTEIIDKICMALGCDVSDIMEITGNQKDNSRI